MGVLALVGTAKGLFVLRGDDERRHWRAEGPLLGGWGVYHATVDARDGTLYAATNHRVYGSTVQRSEDGGRTWRRSQKIGLPEESGLTLEAVWHVEPGRPEEPETLYLGAAPGVLFRSDDGGETLGGQPRAARASHARRAGSPAPAACRCHSVQLDPRDRQRMYVAITAAGVFRTDDAGETWTPCNRGVVAEFLGDPYAEVGQCPHKLLLHPARPDRLWQQNHFGVYRSDDRGDSWAASTRTDCRAASASRSCSTRGSRRGVRDPRGEPRVPLQPRRAACRLRDAGRRGDVAADDRRPARIRAGRPCCARHRPSMPSRCISAPRAARSSRSGTGDQWVEAVRHLPPIFSVEVAAWSR